MNTYQIDLINLPKDDYININHLYRISNEVFYHPNPRFKNILEEGDLQIYIIGKSKYGCFVSKTLGLDEDYQFQFFIYEINQDDLYQAIYVPEFSEVLDDCEPEYLEGILYHLDIIVGKNEE